MNESEPLVYWEKVAEALFPDSNYVSAGKRRDFYRLRRCSGAAKRGARSVSSGPRGLRLACTFSVDEIRDLQAKDLGLSGSDKSPDNVMHSIGGEQPADALPAAL